MNTLVELIGDSPGIQAVRDTIERLLARQSDARRLPPLLIQGETGTGKGLLAQLIHRAGPRRHGPFVDINCAAIPETLLEAELFGFERGAFTDARQAKPGLFQTAHHGTLFLDEIGLLPESLQGKFLTAIEERAVRRLGSTRSEPVDVWVLAASNIELTSRVRDGRFREDLYHRLAVLTVALPPLRERGRDILRLAEHFLGRACRDYVLAPKTLGPDAEAALLAYPWPGNIRELGNVMERVALLADAPVVTAETLGLAPTAAPEVRGRGLDDAPEGVADMVTRLERERDRLLEALRETNWNVSQAAVRLQIPRNTLRYRIEKHGLRHGQPPAAARPRPARPRAGPAGMTPPPTEPSIAAPAPSAVTAVRWEDRRLTLLRAALTAPAPEAEPTPDTNRALEALMEKVQSFGGRVEELGRSGLVAVFGLEPIEDAPRRAAHAAMAIQRISERARLANPDRPAVTVAIHTGPFTVGQASGMAQIDLDAKQEAWTVLQALTAAAEADSVLLSAATAAFLERRFDLTPVGTVPGVPGAAYRLVGLERPGPGRRLVPFIGRQGDLDLLQSRLASAMRGHGQLVGIGGETGIGKSRLLLEFRQSLAGRPITYLEGHCYSYGTATPYLPLLQMLRQNCGITEADIPAVIVDKARAAVAAVRMDADDAAPYLLQLLGVKEGTERLAAVSPEAIKARLFQVMWQLSLQGSRRRPLVLALEDVHWIDNASGAYLDSLVASLAGAPILLVVTYRPGFRAPWLEKSYATQVALQPLGPEESLSIVRAVLQSEAVTESVAQAILAKAEGNPFFLEELTRVIGDPGESGPPPAVPDTVQDVLLARIDGLAEGPKRALHTAAVLGREVPLRLLRETWDGPDALEPHLRELVRLEFLYARPGGDEPAYVFKHALIRDVARESLPAGRRQALHAAAGHALETLYADRLDEVCDRLAYHFSKAKRADKAVGYLSRLADKAARSHAHVEAVTALREALEQIERLPAAERGEPALALVLRQAHSLSFLGRFPESLELLHREHGRLQTPPSAEMAGPYHFWLGHTYSYLGDHARATESAQRALEAAAGSGDEATMGKAYVVLAQENYWGGQPLHGIARSRRAVELLTRADERWWLGLAHWIAGINYVVVGAFDLALEAEARARAAGDALGDPRIQSYATWSTGWIHALTGAWPEGVEACRRALACSRDPLNTAVAQGHLGYVHLESGDPAQALPLLEQAVAQTRQFGFQRLEGRFTTFLGEAYLVRGDTARARELVGRGLALTTESGYRYGVGWAQHALGRIAGAEGSHTDAERHLTAALETFSGIHARFLAARTRLSLAELVHAAGAPDAARAHLDQAYALFRVLRVPHYVARAEALATAWGLVLSEETAGPQLAVVRRGDHELFDALQAHLAELNLSDVIWDRRQGERRRVSQPVAPERRHDERRGPTPGTWDNLGFLLAP